MARDRVEKTKRLSGSKGSLTVEALLFLIPFIMAFCTIINAARFVQAEMIVHHAAAQTAKQISAYSYVLTKAGITQKMQQTNGKSNRFKNTVEEAAGSIQGLADALGQTDELAEGVLSLAKSEMRGTIMTQIAGKLTEENIKKSLSLMTDDPDTFLSDVGIVGGMSGLDFSESKWISNEDGGKGDIQIVVTYTMKNVIFPEFDFGQYEFCQCASTLIW